MAMSKKTKDAYLDAAMDACSYLEDECEEIAEDAGVSLNPAMVAVLAARLLAEDPETLKILATDSNKIASWEDIANIVSEVNDGADDDDEEDEDDGPHRPRSGSARDIDRFMRGKGIGRR